MKRFRDTSYYVTTDGRVFNKNRVEKKVQNVNDYPQMMLYIKKKYTFHYVHRLVAEVYLPNPNNYEYVKHKDGNRWNNNVSNLEWDPNRERGNVTNFRDDIKMETVLAIREKYSKGEKQQVLADEYGLSQAYVSNLVNNKFRNKIKNPTE